MKIYTADLHLHTILSPCGDYGMMPTEIAARAKMMGLDIFAVTDHNSAGNVKAVREAALIEGITVIGGMEITTEEEVHLLVYFDRDEDLLEAEEFIQNNLPGVNDSEMFGDQVFLDSENNILGVCDKLLFGAATLSINSIVEYVHKLGGMVIASHVDRESFSVISQLGYIPEGIELDGVEMVNPGGVEYSSGLAYGFPFISCSDAHYLDDIGKRSTGFNMVEPTVSELKLALQGSQGRGVVR